MVWKRPATSCSPSRVSRKASGNRSAHRMRLNVCTKSSSGGSRRGPSCLPRKPPRCCSGLCWLLARSRCARLTAGEASPRSLPIRSLTSPHEAVISSRGRSRQTQFQHKSRRHQVKNVKDSGGRPYSQWGVANPLPGLVARINEKISVAAAYDKTGYEELWLLISSQLPKIGASISTFAFAPFVNVTNLNKATHMQLCGSSFSAAHFHLMMSHCVYSWSRSEEWHVTKASET